MSACPKCRTDLEPYLRPLPGGTVAATEMCLDCGGIWLDEECLAVTFPELLGAMGTLERREADGATRVCPLCEIDMPGFMLEGLALDGCDRCSGLWVDSHEIQALDPARAAVLARGELGPRGGYREAATTERRAEPIATRACEACAKPFEEKRLVESRGCTICRVCFETESEPLEVPRTVFGHLLRIARVIR